MPRREEEKRNRGRREEPKEERTLSKRNKIQGRLRIRTRREEKIHIA